MPMAIHISPITLFFLDKYAKPIPKDIPQQKEINKCIMTAPHLLNKQGVFFALLDGNVR